MRQPIVQNKFENDCYYVTLYFPKLDKTFEGVCKLHEEDKENASKLKGYFIAEDRAWIKYYKYLRADEKKVLKAFNSFIETYKNSKEYNEKDFLARKLRKERFLIMSRIKELTEAIEELQDIILKRIYFVPKKYKEIINDQERK